MSTGSYHDTINSLKIDVNDPNENNNNDTKVTELYTSENKHDIDINYNGINGIENVNDNQELQLETNSIFGVTKIQEV